MLLDPKTVIFFTILVVSVTALYSWALAAGRSARKWHRFWAVGNTCLLAGAALFLGQGTWSPWISVVLANFFLVTGYLSLESGLRHFTGRKFTSWVPWAHYFIFVVGYFLFTFIWNSYQMRTLVASFLAVGVFARMIGLLGRRMPEERSRHPLVVYGFIAVLGAMIVFYLARAVFVFADATRTNLDYSLALMALFVFSTVGVLTWTIGFTALDLLRNQRLLENSLAVRDRMFSIIAHDLRTPLGGLVSLLELLGRESGSPNSTLMMEAFQASRGAFDLLENLLAWATMQRGEMVFKPTQLDLEDLIEDAVTPLKSSARLKGVQLSVSPAKGMKIYSDRNSTTAIIRNLVSNAIKFSPRGGTIILECSPVEEMTQLKITDSGSGIPVSVLDALELGVLPTAGYGTAGEKGTGLGITLCRDFARANHGKIEFFSSVHGTSATITLPTT